jgi:hypothetical protein
MIRDKWPLHATTRATLIMLLCLVMVFIIFSFIVMALMKPPWRVVMGMAKGHVEQRNIRLRGYCKLECKLSLRCRRRMKTP